MNLDYLHELIERYEAKIDKLYDADNNELFKWRAMKTWRQEWYKPKDSYPSFAQRFSAARKDFSLFIDNSRMHPSAGVLKLWEKEPSSIEHLFCDVLFDDTGDDVSAAQDRMDAFLTGYEALRLKYFPGNWSYKQDRHSASVFLAMNRPDFHFAYKSSEALAMEKYTDFGLSIGTGMSFSLEHYYQLCNEIVSALSEHDSLLQKHFDMLTDDCYEDRSLHLLAFDLIYCCRTYNYYKGLTVPSTGKTKKEGKTGNQNPNEPDPDEIERERLARIAAIEQEIGELERNCDGVDEISLQNVQVNSKKDGVGRVIAQERSKITVQFADEVKMFKIDLRYPNRPHFENDEQIAEIFTDYVLVQDKIKKLTKELKSLQR